MAPRGCLLLPLIFIASTRVIIVNAACGDLPTPDPCVINAAKNCAGCTGSEFVPNPLDCTSYYVCKDGSNFLFEDPFYCPDGQTFDTAKKVCKEDGVCTADCEITSGGECFYTCDGNSGGKIADPYDCSVYQECSATTPGDPETCSAPTPYFNGDECGKDESLCCHCKPYCYADDLNKLVEDPTDCRKYYLCLKAHEIPTIEGRCKDGEHFDIHMKECSSSAPCVTLCRNVVGEDGCIEPFTCQETGFFPVCKTQCVTDYYRCSVVSDVYILPETCPNNLVFNPDTLTCVTNDTCPYNHK